MARGLASCDVEAAVIFGFFGYGRSSALGLQPALGDLFLLFLVGVMMICLYLLPFFFGIVICKETFLVNALFFVIRLRFFSFEVRRQSHNMRLQLGRFWMICEEHLLWIMIQ